MGFAGYFRMTLYKDVELSIEPSSHSPGMISWFPALIPLRKMHRLESGDQVYLLLYMTKTLALDHFLYRS